MREGVKEDDGDYQEAATEEIAEAERRNLEIERGKVQPLSEAEFWQQIEADCQE